jgi:hypothetical protein
VEVLALVPKLKDSLSMYLAVFSNLVSLLLAFPILAASAYLGGRGPSSSSPRPVIASDEVLHIGEFLTSPTTTSIVVSFIPSEAINARVNYGTTRRMGTRTTAVTTTADTREDITIIGLTAGTTYYYQLETKATTEFVWAQHNFNRFTTLRSSGDTYRFGIGADEHAPTFWARADCGNAATGGLNWGYWQMFERAVRTTTDHDLDFWVSLGDTSMSHSAGDITTDACPITTENPGGEYLGLGTIAASAGNSTAQRKAELRWQVLLMGANTDSDTLHGYQLALKFLPWFYVIGNHDLQAPNWGDGDGECGYYDGSGVIVNSNTASTAARALVLPIYGDTYDALQPDPTASDATGRYYTWASGDARFYVLDVYLASTVGDGAPNAATPADAEDWLLGAAQKTWFSAQLAAATETFHIVFLHSFVGASESGQCYHYARGGTKATDDGLITGDFVGADMKWLHDEVAAKGNGVVVKGHDHVSTASEKLNSDGTPSGVHYLSTVRLDRAVAGDFNHDMREIYDENGLIEASAGPALMTTDGTTNYFDCQSCDFVTGGFVQYGILDSSNFPGGADGTYDIDTVTTTRITVTAAEGDEATLTDQTGDGDEILQMRLPDYREDPPVNGEDEPGWYEVTVAPSYLLFRHIINSTDTTIDGTEAFSYRIPQ